MPAPSASKLNLTLKLMFVLGCSAALLGGCGIKGSLKTPPPVFGQKTVDQDRIPEEAPGEEEDEVFEDDLLAADNDTEDAGLQGQ